MWLGGPPGGPGVVGSLSQRSGSGRRPSQRSESGREALREVLVWLAGPPGGLGVVGTPSQNSKRGWEDFSKVWEW